MANTQSYFGSPAPKTTTTTYTPPPTIPKQESTSGVFSKAGKLFDPKSGDNRPSIFANIGLNPLTAPIKLIKNLYTNTRGNPIQRTSQSVWDVLNLTSDLYAGGLQGFKSDVLKQRRTGQQTSNSSFDYGQRLKAGLTGAAKNLEDRQTPTDVVQGGTFKNPVLKAGYNLMSEFAPPDLPIDKIADLVRVGGKTLKLGKFLEPATELIGKYGDNIANFAKETPAIYKAIERIDPGFRVPGINALLDESKYVTKKRLNNLVKTIDEAASGLTPTQRRRVGQLIEGGISVNPDDPLLAIARDMNKLTDQIGKEAVDLGLLNPEAFNELKGRYLTHVWTGGDKVETFSDFVKTTTSPRVSGGTFKYRTGKEGYTRDFAAALVLGLGNEIQDIEAANFYKMIGNRWGISAEPIKKGQSIVKEALDTLRKEYRVPIGGQTEQGAVMTEDIGNYLLNVFKESQPAKRIEGEAAMGTRAILKGKTPQEITGWVREQGAAFQRVFGFTPDESRLATVLERVGELPGPKQRTKLFGKQSVERILEEGFGYAPKEIKNKKIAAMFENVALPNEVIDYINRTSDVKPATIFDKALDLWKQGKTIYNPAYHMRNIISNQILSSMATNRSIEETVLEYIGSVRRYADKNNEIVKVAENIGLLDQKTFIQAFKGFADNAGEISRGKFEYISNFVKRLQQTSEETAKLNVFTSIIQDEAIKVGKTLEEALADEKIVKKAFDMAEKSLFSPYRIGDGERTLVKQLIPFYTFTRQVVPFTIDTAIKRPRSITGLVRRKRAIESLSQNLVPNKDRKDYQRDDIQIPQGLANILGAKGKPTLLDTTYISPFGNIGEEGDFGLPFGLSGNPFLSELYQQELNKDSFFGTDIATSQLPGVGLDTFSPTPFRAGSQRLQHALNTLAPSFYRSVVSKIAPAAMGVPDYAGRDRSFIMAVLDAAGLKLSIVDPAENRKWQQKDKQYRLQDIDADISKVRTNKQMSNEMKQYVIDMLKQRRVQVQRGN